MSLELRSDFKEEGRAHSSPISKAPKPDPGLTSISSVENIPTPPIEGENLAVGQVFDGAKEGQDASNTSSGS